MRTFQRIALLGYRATGKSRVGEVLARRLRCPAIDTDTEVQRRAQCTIRELFRRRGEEAFRDLESEVIAELTTATSPDVLSLGGGAVLRQENRQALQATCANVWLRAQPEEIWRRLKEDAATTDLRPALTDLSEFDEIVAVLSAREEIYRGAADVQVDTDGKDVVQIAEEILSLLSDERFGPLAQWVAQSLNENG